MPAPSKATATPFKPRLASREGGDLRYNNNVTQTRLLLDFTPSSSPSGLKHVTIADLDIVLSHLKVYSRRLKLKQKELCMALHDACRWTQTVQTDCSTDTATQNLSQYVFKPD